MLKYMEFLVRFGGLAGRIAADVAYNHPELGIVVIVGCDHLEWEWNEDATGVLFYSVYVAGQGTKQYGASMGWNEIPRHIIDSLVNEGFVAKNDEIQP